MEISKLFELLLTAAAGGGLSWLVFFNFRRRSESAKASGEESDVLDSIVRNTTKQTADLLAKMQEMGAHQAEVLSQVNQLNEKLRYIKQLVIQMLIEYEGTETPTISALRNAVKPNDKNAE